MTEEQICKSCKYFDGKCKNYFLSRPAKTKRLNGSECEYWEEREVLSEEMKALKRELLEIAIRLENIVFSIKDEK